MSEKILITVLIPSLGLNAEFFVPKVLSVKNTYIALVDMISKQFKISCKIEDLLLIDLISNKALPKSSDEEICKYITNAHRLMLV